mmetsp:Transcript_9975/g.24557  ORF Transcript_9975/g.24557 Transcript_9975/m.24557 type:complete len:84 (-) Transcript_9975:364-615(-)
MRTTANLGPTFDFRFKGLCFLRFSLRIGGAKDKVFEIDLDLRFELSEIHHTVTVKDLTNFSFVHNAIITPNGPDRGAGSELIT